MKIVILGTGASKGVPEAGNYWGKANPEDKRNQRTRSSMIFQFNGHNFLVDSGPDFREQINKNNISCIDSVLFTHGHSDHIDGFSDLVWLTRNQDKDINLYATNETYEIIMRRYADLFHPQHGDKNIHRVHWKIIENGEKINVGGEEFQTFPVIHSQLEPTAVRYKNFCYVPDFNKLDDRAYKHLNSIDVLLINANDGFERKTYSSQSSFYEVIELNDKICAGKVLLSHVRPIVDHETDEKKLPENISIAYDGMVLEF